MITAGTAAGSAGAEVDVRGTAGASFGFFDTKLPAFELVAVEFLDRVGNRLLVLELDESETSRLTGVAVRGQKNFDYVADF